MIKIRFLIIIHAALTLTYYSCVNNKVYKSCEPDKIYGKWVVKEWKYLININRTVNEQQEYDDVYNHCIGSMCIINADSISILNNTCEWETCYKPFDKCDVNILPVVEDDENTMRYPGQEIIYKNKVGKTFLGLFNTNTRPDSITTINTDYTIPETGGQNLIICILSENQIGLFSGFDLIVLHRMRS